MGSVRKAPNGFELLRGQGGRHRARKGQRFLGESHQGEVDRLVSARPKVVAGRTAVWRETPAGEAADVVCVTSSRRTQAPWRLLKPVEQLFRR